MRLTTLSPAPGSKKAAKRVGRGNGSGHGTYSGRGCKGQKSRAGYSRNPGFEGGQLPLIKRLPRKRGFTNIFRVEYNVVSLTKLNVFEAGSEVGLAEFRAAGIIRSLRKPIKVLADGEIDRALTVTAHKFSVAARSRIEAAGGEAREVADAAKAV
ncbi:MAG: 50S ribosomal protein L15 [Dehalococcoidales bacterium]